MALRKLALTCLAPALLVTSGAAAKDDAFADAFTPAETRDAALAAMADDEVAAYCSYVSRFVKTAHYEVSGSEQADPSVESATAWNQIYTAQIAGNAGRQRQLEAWATKQVYESQPKGDAAKNKWLAERHRACAAEREARFAAQVTDMRLEDSDAETISVEYVGEDFTGASSAEEQE